MLGYFSTKRCKGAGKCPIKSNQTEITTDGDYVSEQEIYFHKMDSNAPGSSDRWLPRTTSSPAGANRIELILGDCVITGKLDQRRQQRLRGKTYNLQNADLH